MLPRLATAVWMLLAVLGAGCAHHSCGNEHALACINGKQCSWDNELHCNVCYCAASGPGGRR